MHSSVSVFERYALPHTIGVILLLPKLILLLQVEAQSLELKARLADGKSLVQGIANGGINASHLEEAVTSILYSIHFIQLVTACIVYLLSITAHG